MNSLHDNSGNQAFSPEEVAAHFASIPEWTADEDVTSISRTWIWTSFAQALSFVQEVAALAEELHHHPEILIAYKKVTLTLSTHSVGGLTEKDFMLASHIDHLDISPNAPDKAESFLAG